MIDKGLAEFNFYNVKTWPAEKDGYTTAMLTFTVDSTNKSHAPEEWGNVRSWKNVGGIDLFDFGDKKWDLTSWSEEKAIRNWEGYNYTDVSHYDYTENFSKVKSLYVTYPNDYDGLSFAVQSKGEAKYYGFAIRLRSREIKRNITGGFCNSGAGYRQRGL